METKLVKILPENIKHPQEQALLEMAGSMLLSGGIVAFPTETVYGLGANAFDPAAAEKIYAAKGRPSDNPLIVHIAERESLARLIDRLPEKAEALMDAFWPGPLTLIFEKNKAVPDKITGGLSTVAVRCPQNEVARSVIEAGGGFIAAPSANRSGHPSPTAAEHVFNDLDGRVDMIIDGGSSVLGLESTIVDLTVSPPAILRPGFITREMLEEVIGGIAVDKGLLSEKSPKAPKAPGMKYRHYAPRAGLTLIEGEPTQAAAEIRTRTSTQLKEGISVGIMATEETLPYYKEWLQEPPAGLIIKSIGSRLNPESIAGNLYRVLREFDQTPVSEIYAEAFEGKGLGAAIENRMAKAAGGHIVRLHLMQEIKALDRVLIISKTDGSRGPLAAYFLNRETAGLSVPVESAGLVVPFAEPVNPLMESAAQHFHTSLMPHKARQLKREDIRESTLFFTPDTQLKLRTMKSFEGIRHIYTFAEFLEREDAVIPSPYGQALSAYEDCYKKTRDLMEQVAKKLRRVLAG